MTSAPLDGASRERIREDFSATLFVEAGAGTGKTTELVRRIVGLIAGGHTTVEQLAAITFTEAAAAELRDRVLVAFEQASVDPAASHEVRQRCTAALRALDEAAIETLHAFASRILSAHALEAGLPPGFEVADDTLATIAFAERWRDHLETMLDDPALQVPLRHVLALGVSAEGLRAVALELHEHWDRLDGEALDSPGDVDIAREARAIADELQSVCAQRAHCVDSADRLNQHLQKLELLPGRLHAAANDEVALLGLLGAPIRSGNAGRQENWRHIAPKEIRNAITAIDDRRVALLANVGASATASLYQSLRGFVLEYAEERRQAGRLEFHDLLVRARNLLRDNAEVRWAMRRRFSHLLIDEFQDTDPLQAEIAFLLTAPSAGIAADWRTVDAEAGRLFFVGDPKQSIYRFRRADIELYQWVQKRLVDGATTLTQNFRSAPAVIEWVNALFERLMDGDEPGQASYIPLQATRGPHPDGVTVTLLGGPMEGNVGAVRTAEAAEIVRVLRAAKADRWQVQHRRDDDGTEHYRDVRYQDVAILLPARTALPPLLEALETSGIPYRLESRSLVYETQEVRELLSILQAIDDPTDEVALVAALRSPAFACGDDDLLAFAEARGRWDYRAIVPDAVPDSSPVRAAMTWLRGAYERRWWTPVSTLLEQVIRERRLLELAMVDQRPRERWQRLRFMLDQSRAFADAGGRTLSEFLSWAERQAEEDARVIESVAPEPDDDAVRITTVHAAKGLEFAVTVLTGLNAEPNRSTRPVLWGMSGRPEVRLGREVASPGFAAASERETNLEKLQYTRLLYVAATRARDHLVVSLFQTIRQSPATRIYEAVQEFPHLWRRFEAPEAAEAPAEATTAELDTRAAREAWQAARQQALTERASIPAVAATALAGHALQGVERDPNLQKDPPIEEQPPWRRGRAGTALGRAVHSTLQTIDLATGDGLEHTARAQAAAEGVPHRAAEVAQRVRAALEAPSVRAAVAVGRYWREVYVGVPLEGVVVEGFIDLLYETSDGYVVVDYKTDQLATTESIDQALGRYRLQGAAYAVALAESLGRPVARCVFVFLTTDGAVERGIMDLDAAMAEARDRAAMLAR